MPLKLTLVSGGCPPRFRSHVNHGVYAHLHDLSYCWDIRQYYNLQTPHFHKIAAVLRILPKHDWVIWMDDDAFFTDLHFNIKQFVQDEPDEVFMVACRSPINPQGGWTFLNSGVFFMRNCDLAQRFLNDVLSTPKSEIVSRWNHAEYGLLTPGEQAHIIYLLHNRDLLTKVKLHDWSAFNARPYHWSEGAPLDAYPVAHFPVDEKAKAIESFAARFGLDDTLLPKYVSADVRNSVELALAHEAR